MLERSVGVDYWSGVESYFGVEKYKYKKPTFESIISWLQSSLDYNSFFVWRVNSGVICLHIYLHCHRLSLDESILDQQGSYIDERQLTMWHCR